MGHYQRSIISGGAFYQGINKTVDKKVHRTELWHRSRCLGEKMQNRTKTVMPFIPIQRVSRRSSKDEKAQKARKVALMVVALSVI